MLHFDRVISSYFLLYDLCFYVLFKNFSFILSSQVYSLQKSTPSPNPVPQCLSRFQCRLPCFPLLPPTHSHTTCLPHSHTYIQSHILTHTHIHTPELNHLLSHSFMLASQIHLPLFLLCHHQCWVSGRQPAVCFWYLVCTEFIDFFWGYMISLCPRS